MSFFGQLGQDLGDLFTGRWTGGQTNLASDNLTPLLTAGAAVAAPFAAPAIGGALGFGEAATAGGAGGGFLGGLFGGGGDIAAAVDPTLTDAVAGGSGPVGSFVGPGLDVGTGVSSVAPTPLSTAIDPMNLDPTIANSYASADPTAGWQPAPADTSPAGSYVPQGDPTALPGDPTANPPMQLGGGTATGAPPDAPWYQGIVNSVTHPTLGGVAQAAGAGAAGLGLVANLAKGQQQSAQQNQMTNLAAFGTQQAQSLIGQSQQLESYLQNGTLPPALQAQVTQQANALKASIIANAAKNGQSTDPTQNSALGQDLAAADRQALIMAGQMETWMFQQGQTALNTALQSAGISSQLYTSLANMEQAQQTALTSSIGQFAASLVGPKLNLSPGGTKTA